MKNKGTIIYVGTYQLPDKDAAAHRVLNNAKIFRTLGYNIVFVDIDTALTNNIKLTERKKDVQGFETWSLCFPQKISEWIRYYISIQSVIEVLENYEDVKAVICYNYMSIPLYRMKKYCNKKNIKIIADVTEWYSIKKNKGLIKFLKGVDTFLRMSIIHKKMDGLIVISNYLKEYYSEFKNVVCIPPLVDLNEDKWKKLNLELKDEKINLIYAGNIGKEKDQLNYIINSLNNLGDNYNFSFNVIGITKCDYLAQNKELAYVLENLQNKIQFWGRCNHIEIIKEIMDSDFTVFIRESNRVTNAGFPTKFAESISCGTPVITTNTSDLRCYLKDGVNGFLTEISNLDKTLEKVLSLPKKEILDMKEYCYKSRMFHYENYTKKIKKFMINLFNS